MSGRYPLDPQLDLGTPSKPLWIPRFWWIDIGWTASTSIAERVRLLTAFCSYELPPFQSLTPSKGQIFQTLLTWFIIFDTSYRPQLSHTISSSSSLDSRTAKSFSCFLVTYVILYQTQSKVFYFFSRWFSIWNSTRNLSSAVLVEDRPYQHGIFYSFSRVFTDWSTPGSSEFS